ncbi:hypothetical protein EAE96_003268 [Botrytis aclada]|nr:hypothetical protein EAE96_003268 [Botrytis aclada]
MAAVHARSMMARDQLPSSSSSLTDTASSSSIERNEVEQPIPSINLPVGAEIGIGLIIGIVTCTTVLAILLLFSYIRRNRAHRLAAKDPPALCVNAEDNPPARRQSWTQDSEIHQKTPDEDSSHIMSQHRWTSPDDVAPRYEPHEQQIRQKDSFDEIQMENREELADRQNRQHPHSISHVYSNSGEETPSYSSHHDSYGSWRNSLSTTSQVPSYNFSSSSQQQQEQPVYSSDSNPTPSQSHHYQQEMYMLRQESLKIQHPAPSYSPWRNHKLLKRIYSVESAQQPRNRDETRSQLETQQEVAHIANKQTKVKRGSTTDNQSASNPAPSKTRKPLKAAPKRKTKDKTSRENSSLTKPSNFQKTSAGHNSAVSAEPKSNQKAKIQDQDRKRDQIPHPLQSHPYSTITHFEISKSHKEEKPLPSPPTEHPLIPELEGSEQKFL